VEQVLYSLSRKDWAIGQPMLCGDHKWVDIYDNILTDVFNGSFYGIV
jgi:hypothetical protein